jgi:hypothetical protein
MIKAFISGLGTAALCLHLSIAPAAAEMSDDEKTAAAIAILGIAALAHHKHHYQDGYSPASGAHAADFERGYRDALHGYTYDERNGTRDYAQGYEAGLGEREGSMAHRRNTSAADKAPHMALVGCADIVAQNYAISSRSVHFGKTRSPRKHEWEIEAKVGHDYMVCKMRDSGEVIELRGGRL